MFLETDRLIIKDFNIDDCYNLFKLDNDKDVMKYIASYSGDKVSLEECKSNIIHQINYYKKNLYFGIWPVFLKENDEFIGWCALRPVPFIRDIELGYRLLKKHWGYGYATEATKALIDYAFDDLNLECLTANAMPQNNASIRVMEKSGMIFIKYDVINSVYIKNYIITKTIWMKGRVNIE